MDLTPSTLENVSRETAQKLSVFVNALLKWNKVHNLIAEGTEKDVLERHILDSLQLLKYLPENLTTILDFGSGAGFPGFVLAAASSHKLVLCEKSAKRTAFLRYVSRETKVDCEVFDKDLAADAQIYQVVVSRAVSNLNHLWELCGPRIAKGGYALFLKGENFQEELNKFFPQDPVTIDLFPSITNGNSVIIKLTKR